MGRPGCPAVYARGEIMETPFIRAKAKDTVDTLDNVTAYLEPSVREEIVECVMTVFRDIERVLDRAEKEGINPVDAYKIFLQKFNEYWNISPH
jgi:hypothetical protein